MVTLFSEEKLNHLHARLCQDPPDTILEDKQQKTCLAAYFVCQSRNRSKKGACLSPYIHSFDF